MRPYTEFRNKRLGKRIDYDGAYGFQCVDLIKQYLDECLGLGKIGSLGNAKAMPSNPCFAKREKLGTDNLMQGDIIVRTRGMYGHVAIVDHIHNGKVFVLEQNGSGKDSGSGTGANAIRIKDYRLNWYDLVLRNIKIFKNLQLERKFVAEKIKKLQQELKHTEEYIAMTRYLKDSIGVIQ